MHLTRSMIQEVEKLSTLGMHKEHIANALRIGESTFYSYQQIGREVEDEILTERRSRDDLSKRELLCLEFLEALKKGRGEAIKSALSRIRQAGKSSWQAEAWFLERTFPESYGRRDRHELAHSGNIHQEHSLDEDTRNMIEKEIETIFPSLNEDDEDDGSTAQE